MTLSCYFPLIESNQRSSPDKASTRITKKRIWLLCYISRLKGTQFFVIRPFLPIVQTLRNSRWTGRTHPRCLDGPPRGFDVMSYRLYLWFFKILMIRVFLFLLIPLMELTKDQVQTKLPRASQKNEIGFCATSQD